MTDDEDPYADDAWRKYDNLVNELSTYTEVRGDIHIHAIAYNRGVELIVFSGPVADMKRKWQSTGKRNVSTMRELAQALNDACDFVESNNPKWAGK
jgi:hypothetical protein